jgi:hypothetical protein
MSGAIIATSLSLGASATDIRDVFDSGVTR